MGSGSPRLSRGRYLAWEAGRLAGVSGTTIGQWARRGYIRTSVSQELPHVYGFQDVAEAMVVHELLERGVTHRDIRRAIDRLTEYGDWPLTDASIGTQRDDGHVRVVVREREGTYDIGERGWQQVVDPDNLELVRSELRRGGWAVRALPDLHHIEVDPARLGGRPCIRGRRIAVEDVVAMAAEPDGVVMLREGYALSDAEIDDARRWMEAVAEIGATP